MRTTKPVTRQAGGNEAGAMSRPSNHRKRFWVWVTGPNYYLDETGQESAALDPRVDPSEMPDSWWTCHRDTSPGDLVLLYRTRPKSDLAYLLEARSKARIWREFPIGTLTVDRYQAKVANFFAAPTNRSYAQRYEKIDGVLASLGLKEEDIEDLLDANESDVPPRYRRVWRDHRQLWHDVNRAMGMDPEPILAREWEGAWVSDYEPRFKLDNPLSLETLRADRFLAKEWPALRANFRQRVYGVPESIWQHLVDLIARRNSAFRPVVMGLMGSPASADIISEKKLEDALVRNLRCLAPDFDVELFRAEDGASGRQYPCTGSGGAMGFIDLLCVDRRDASLLVIELKVVRASLAAFAQLRSYIGWVREHVAKGRPVRGLLISDGVDEKYRYASSASEDIRTLELGDIRNRL